MNKTCNGGYCQYKTCNMLCTYEGYCDHQCPKDSRTYSLETKICLCSGGTTLTGICSVCGGNK